MISLIKVAEKGFTKTQNLEGNYNIINDDVFVNASNTLPAFYTEKILKTDKTLGTITSLKAKRIDVRGIVIFLDSDRQPVVLTETVITSPSNFVTLQSNTSYNWYYSTVLTFNQLQSGYYIFEFSDGTYDFETDIICLNSEIIESLPVTFDSTVTTFDVDTLTMDATI